MSMIKLSREDIDNFQANYTYPTPADGMLVYTVLLVHGGSLQVRFEQHFETAQATDAFLAALPKSYRVRKNTSTQVIAGFDFYANGITGDVNEAAGKRLRAFLKKLDALGVPVTHRAQRVTNDQPSIDEVLAMIDAPIIVGAHG
jgi:hypothetical protein